MGVLNTAIVSMGILNTGVVNNAPTGGPWLGAPAPLLDANPGIYRVPTHDAVGALYTTPVFNWAMCDRVFWNMVFCN